ncbi:hypothetical protein, partial [Eggerthella lenta]|uniref:hypothetical protein n=1 Tax=Eggerthella lenta TaxID=84112 RepID=UPI001E2F514F
LRLRPIRAGSYRNGLSAPFPLPHAPSAWRQLSITDSVMDKNRLDSVIFSEDRSNDKPLTWHYKKRHSGLAEFGVKNY